MTTQRKRHHNMMDRRDFIKTMAVASAGTMLPVGSLIGDTSKKINRPNDSVSMVGIPSHSDVDHLFETVQNAARAATDFAWLSRGDTVYIKPALNSGNLYPATTNPTGVKAMVSLLKEKGAGRVIIGDMSGREHISQTPDEIEGSSRELLTASGIARAAVETGAELYFQEEDGWDAFYEDEPVDATYWNKPIMMPKILKEVDHIVQMPRCGRHVLLGSSLAMKNTVGYWRFDSRLEYHKYAASIQEKTADANTVKTLLDKQRLVLTVGTKILTTYGPDKGFVKEPETGLVYASESIVAHDMVSLAWLIRNRMAMTEDEKDDANDPYQSDTKVRLANHLVVTLLGGIGDAIDSERLTRNDLNTIWDDRVLNRAYEVFGGVPDINLLNVDDTVSGSTIETFSKMVTPVS